MMFEGNGWRIESDLGLKERDMFKNDERTSLNDEDEWMKEWVSDLRNKEWVNVLINNNTSDASSTTKYEN